MSRHISNFAAVLGLFVSMAFIWGAFAQPAAARGTGSHTKSTSKIPHKRVSKLQVP